MKEVNTQDFFKAIVQSRYQIFAIIFTTIMTIFLAKQALNTLRDLEPSPDVTSITKAKMEKWQQKPEHITAGLHIINIPEFNLMDNEFLIDAIVWFEFNPKYISLDKVGKFAFEKGEIQKKSDPVIRKEDQYVFVEYKVKLKFTSNLTHQFFPLDDHRIYITLINTHILPQDIAFSEEQKVFTLSDGIYTPGWNIMGYGMQTGYTKAELDARDAKKTIRYPEANFYIDFRRSGVRQILLILLPLFLMFFIGLFAFMFDPKTNAAEIRAIASGAITSMIAYRFVIQGMSPEVGYFMLSDHIFTIFLVFAFIEFILALIMVQKGALTSFLNKVRGIAFLTFHILFLAIWYYLLFLWA